LAVAVGISGFGGYWAWLWSWFGWWRGYGLGHAFIIWFDKGDIGYMDVAWLHWLVWYA